MRPELFTLFGIPFHAHRAFLAVAVLACSLLIARESRKRNLGFVIPPITGLWALLGALVGARLFWVVQNVPASEWWRAALLWEGGFMLYGGLLGGTLAVWAYFRRADIPFAPAADTMAPYVALGEAITRVGCFLNGCCWGKPTTVPWGVSFPPGCPAFEHALGSGLLAEHGTKTLPLHPTQLYMAVGSLGVFALLKYVLARQHRTGTTVMCFVPAYVAVRSAVEVFRDDTPRYWGGLTAAHCIGFALLAFVAIWGWRMTRRR